MCRIHRKWMSRMSIQNIIISRQFFNNALAGKSEKPHNFSAVF